jgi:hypothetical protein
MSALYIGDVSTLGFVYASVREFGIGLCKDNYLMHRASLGVLAGVVGRARPGLRPGLLHRRGLAC